MRICVVGLGYIGLPTASVLATKGFDVVGVDVSQTIVDTINRGQIHIFEPSLDVMVRSAINSGKLRASIIPEVADVFIIAVPTPFKGDHVPDMAYVESATKSIIPVLKPGDLVILESTSPVGSTEMIGNMIRHQRNDLFVSDFKSEVHDSKNQIYVAHCPERVLPGQILRELVENDRIVGGIDAVSTEKACALYQSFVQGTVVPTDCRTAEMAKLTENSFRDVNIAFANEISMVCDKIGINVWELIRLANRHPRVKILEPGPGVGGHCIAVDPWFIVHSCPDEARLIRTAREVNDHKPKMVIEKIREKASKFKSPRIACLGLAFKPDVDDLRESPALEICYHLAKQGLGQILVAEPHVLALPESLSELNNIMLVNVETAIAEADIVVMLVSHKCFRSIDRKVLNEKIVIDTRGFWQ